MGDSLNTKREGVMALVRCRLQAAVLLLVAGTPAVAGLECDQAVVNAGEVRSGAALRHVFRIVNRGPGSAEVVDVRSSCGCLRPKIEKRLLSSGEETILPVEVNTLRQGDGSHTWQIHICYTADGQPGDLTVLLAARIVSEIRIEPPALAVVTETGASHVLTLTDRRPRPLAVMAVESTSPDVRPHVREAGPAKTTIRIEIAPDCLEGRHAAVVRILTDDPIYRELEVPVTVEKRTPHRVRASPEVVELDGWFDKPLPSRIVLLSSGDEVPVGIDQIETESPAVECRWAPGPGARATLRLRVDVRQVTTASFESKVRVHLAGAEAQTVVIPIRCTLR
jgi:hypothetical protein